MNNAFEIARSQIAQALAHRAAQGQTTRIASLDVCATEDGKGAVIFCKMLDGSYVTAAFEFGVQIQPGDFDSQPYLEQCLWRVPTLH